MCGKKGDTARAFWSIDASFAMVFVVIMVAVFFALADYAESLAKAYSARHSGSMLSARFSSIALSDFLKGRRTDLAEVLKNTERDYASIRVLGSEGELYFDFEGERSGEVYCTSRMAWHKSRLIRLEACVG